MVKFLVSRKKILENLKLDFEKTNKKEIDFAIFKFKAQVYDLNALQLLKLQLISLPLIINSLRPLFKRTGTSRELKVYDAVYFYDKKK